MSAHFNYFADYKSVMNICSSDKCAGDKGYYNIYHYINFHISVVYLIQY